MLKSIWKDGKNTAADIFRMTALIEHHTNLRVNELSEEEIGKEFAKLVFVLEWKSEQVNG